MQGLDLAPEKPGGEDEHDDYSRPNRRRRGADFHECERRAPRATQLPSPQLEVELEVSEGVPRELPKNVYRNVLLVVREALEALANARRHSSAQRVRVALDAPEEELRLEVTDDGVGFDPRQSPEGVGLGAMRERSAALGGELKVSSEPGKGTTVRLRLPLPP